MHSIPYPPLPSSPLVVVACVSQLELLAVQVTPKLCQKLSQQQTICRHKLCHNLFCISSWVGRLSKEKDEPKRDVKDQLHFRHSMILKEEAWEQKHERNWDRKPTSERHQKLLLSGIDHCQAGIRAEDKAWLQGRVHIRLVLCYGIHIAVIGKQWRKIMQKMVPLLSLQVPWPAASLLPSLCNQEQWHQHQHGTMLMH